MPLFDLSGSAIRPFRRLNSSADVYESEIEQLFWGNLEAFAEEPLFAVARQARLTGGGIPDIVALDAVGRIVVIEIKRDVDRSQLAQCLEYAGWARNASLDELAGLYAGGPEGFFRDWQDFTATPTPMLLDRSPRLLLVARSLEPRTRSAFDYLGEGGVPVELLTVTFYEDTAGNRIVDVDGRDATSAARATSRPRPSTPALRAARAVGVTLADLLEAGVINADEEIEWRRSQLNQLHRARIKANGEVELSDGRPFTSLSTAADALSGTSNNGWETWTVPRLGNVKIGTLRRGPSSRTSTDAIE